MYELNIETSYQQELNVSPKLPVKPKFGGPNPLWVGKIF